MIKKIFEWFFSPIYKAIVQELSIDFFTNDLIRLGKNNDGGYVVLKSRLPEYDNLISFGIAGDISFERDFQHQNNSSIYCFDPSIDELPEFLPKTKFFKLGIDSSNHKGYINLNEVLSLTGITRHHKIFLKMDIEGYEWKILGDKESFEILSGFDQVVVEFHIKYLLGKSKYLMPLELIKRLVILKKLKKSFLFYNLNANNVCGYTFFKNFIFPEVIEISMINRRFLSQLDNINQPSDPSLPNIQKFINEEF